MAKIADVFDCTRHSLFSTKLSADGLMMQIWAWSGEGEGDPERCVAVVSLHSSVIYDADGNLFEECE